jgi:hypothetical protein
VKGKLRTAAEAIHAGMGDPSITFKFGRRAFSEHAKAPCLKFVPVGGTISRPKRTAGKTVAGTAGMLVPNPLDPTTFDLNRPNTDKRAFESVQRETRMLAFVIAEQGTDEADGIDRAEALLEKFLNAANDAYGHEVTMSERWIIQEDERAGLAIAGEAVVVTLDFMFPVIREQRPLIRVGGFTQTCKLDNTLEDDSPPGP